jgi:glycosyltransferase involved in cell wall biosynthesis
MVDEVRTRLARHDYVAVQVSELGTAPALPPALSTPIVYDAHNCESTLLQRRAGIEQPPLSWILAFEARQIRQYESAVLTRCNLVLVTSPQDGDDLEALVPGRPKHVVPSAVDYARFTSVRSVSPEPLTLLVTGSMTWRPNVQGLRWFEHQVLPRLDRRMSAPPRVLVAGRMHRSLIGELNRRGRLEAVPNPHSMMPSLSAATAVVVPVLASSGTRLRILEAWAAGRPVATTRAGAFGLPAVADRDLLVADHPDDLAACLARLLLDRGLARRLREAGLAQARQHNLTWVREEVQAAYATLLDPERSAA